MFQIIPEYLYVDAKYIKCNEFPEHGAKCKVGAHTFRHMHLFYTDGEKDWRICVNGKALQFKPVSNPKTGLRSFSNEYEWYQPWEEF